MRVRQLAKQLRDSGWPDEKKLLILAARFYLGLETEQTLIVNARASARDVNFILYNR